jgi:uncharacterized protein
MNPIYLLLFMLLSLLAEILGTIGGFGSSVFFVPIANYFLDFQSVLGVTALFHVASNISKIVLFREGIDKKVILYIGIPAVIFVIAGAFLSKVISGIYLQIILSLFLISFSLFFLIKRKTIIPPTIKNSIIGGSLSGISAGLLGTGGAIRGMTMSAFNLEKNIFIASSAIIDFGVDLSRTVIYFYNGYMHREDLYLIPMLLVISVTGTYAGKKILRKISQEKFRIIVLSLILVTGIISLITWL